jgi:hypothetical protein
MLKTIQDVHHTKVQRKPPCLFPKYIISIMNPQVMNGTHIQLHRLLETFCIDHLYQRIWGKDSSRDQGRRHYERKCKDVRRQHDGTIYDVGIVQWIYGRNESMYLNRQRTRSHTDVSSRFGHTTLPTTHTFTRKLYPRDMRVPFHALLTRQKVDLLPPRPRHVTSRWQYFVPWWDKRRICGSQSNDMKPIWHLVSTPP